MLLGIMWEELDGMSVSNPYGYSPLDFEAVLARAKNLCQTARGFFIVEHSAGTTVPSFVWVSFGRFEERRPELYLRGNGGRVVGRYVWHDARWKREDIHEAEPEAGGITWP